MFNQQVFPHSSETRSPLPPTRKGSGWVTVWPTGWSSLCTPPVPWTRPTARPWVAEYPQTVAPRGSHAQSLDAPENKPGNSAAPFPKFTIYILLFIPAVMRLSKHPFLSYVKAAHSVFRQESLPPHPPVAPCGPTAASGPFVAVEDPPMGPPCHVSVWNARGGGVAVAALRELRRRVAARAPWGQTPPSTRNSECEPAPRRLKSPPGASRITSTAGLLLIHTGLLVSAP